MFNVWGYFLGPSHGITPAAVTTNKNIKLSSFKGCENIQKKEGGQDSTVSNNQFFSVTLIELAKNANRGHIIISRFREAVNPKTDIYPKGFKIAQTCLEYMSLNLKFFLISQNTSADLKGPKVKNKLHYV